MFYDVWGLLLEIICDTLSHNSWPTFFNLSIVTMPWAIEPNYMGDSIDVVFHFPMHVAPTL
jgi:hypothetical protein